MPEDRRQQPDNADIPSELIAQGRNQLEAEIKLLEIWLKQLDETRKDNQESLAARKAYSDMLQSRRDFLAALQKYK